MSRRFATLEGAVSDLLSHTDPEIALAAPLGLGKPHRLLNAIYRRVAADPTRSLKIYTALSLTLPKAGSDLERRFLEPFIARHFGADFADLEYAVAQKRDGLPANVEVEEFYLQSGALLGSRQAQRAYANINYTHVARAVASRRINAFVQKVARSPDGSRLSLSCNPDLSFDLLDEIARLGLPRPYLIAEVDPQLPFLDGTAAVDADFFDAVLDLPGPAPKLFALPRQSVSDADYAIGLYASVLVKDGGTLQIGIGSLSDALCHALILRHTRNADYLRLLEALAPGLTKHPLISEAGGTAPFVQGLYGASEMVNDGFMRLHQAGILKRRVLDDAAAMIRINAGMRNADDDARLRLEGRWLDGGFYLGSRDLYDWLRTLPESEKRGLGMTRISHINELYGGNEALERLQRRDARFFNTCMMMTALGAAASDALADGRVVSGVGGQYNFVAMAHALRDGRSVLMLRAVRESGGRSASNVLWNYGHATIPRHLRDVAITEYGIADLRDASDEDCARRMTVLADARFQAGLIARAKASLKLAADFSAPPAWRGNTPQRLLDALRPFRQSGLLPDYPLGCDFTEEEQRLVRALGWLKAAARTPIGKARTMMEAVIGGPIEDIEAMRRMGLDKPKGLDERLNARLVALALRRTRL
jgi:acyl-CoA hydrolase